MLRKASEAVPEGNGSVPQKEELGSDQLTWRDVYRIMKAASDLPGMGQESGRDFG